MTQQVSTVPSTSIVAAKVKDFGDFLKRLLKSPSAKIGGSICLVLVVTAMFAPIIAPYDPTELGVGQALQPPNWDNWFGTDEFGRDLCSAALSTVPASPCMWG
jgi:peptide/nickel transport system permease protein